MPEGGFALPPLAAAVPLTVHIAGGEADDPYAWLEHGDADATKWMEEQLSFSRTFLDALPAPPGARDKLMTLGAAPWRIAELRAGGDAMFYVLPDGAGGPSAPAHLMIAAANQAPVAVFGVEQPALVRPSPDGKAFALGRPGDVTTRTIVVFSRDAKRLETLQHATTMSVVWTRDSKSFYYVGYPGGDIPAVLHHTVGDASDKDRPIFGAAAFGRNQIVAKDGLTVSIGNKNITVAVRAHASGRTTVFTTSLAAALSTEPAWRDVTPPLGFAAPPAHGDSLILVPAAGAKSTGLMRVDLNQAAPGEAFGAAGARATATAEGDDAVYIIRDGKVSRLAPSPGAQEEALDVPAELRAVAIEASPFVPGARAFFSSCTGGGWFSYVPGDRSAHRLVLDPLVAEPRSLEVRTLAAKRDDASAEMTVLARRGLGPGVHPTVLFPHGCSTWSPELGPWLDGGGVAAFCDLHPIHATTPLAVVEGRRKQSAELVACAHALVDQNIATRGGIGIRAAGSAGLTVLSALMDEPQLVKAVAIGHGVFDARRPGSEILPEYQVRDSDEHISLAASIPYLHLQAALPPFLLVLSPNKEDAAANWQSMKLAARLEAARPDALAALVVQPKDTDDGKHGPGGTAPVIADVDAFMRAELDPTAKALPVVVRSERGYAATHASDPKP